MLQGSLFKQWWRLGGICGVLFIVVFVVGVLIQGNTPTYGDPTDEIRNKWVDNGNAYLVGDYITTLGVILFFFPFVSALRVFLGAAEGGSQMFSRVVMVGAVLFVALGLATGASWSTLAFGDFAKNASDDTLKTLMGLNTAGTHLIFVGTSIMALSTAAVIWQARALPMWLGALSLIYGVLASLAPLSVFSNNPDDSVFTGIGFLGAGIWFLAVSITLTLHKDAPQAAM